MECKKGSPWREKLSTSSAAGFAAPCSLAWRGANLAGCSLPHGVWTHARHTRRSRRCCQARGAIEAPALRICRPGYGREYLGFKNVLKQVEFPLFIQGLNMWNRILHPARENEPQIVNYMAICTLTGRGSKLVITTLGFTPATALKPHLWQLKLCNLYNVGTSCFWNEYSTTIT